jgi:hypothetical protein
MCSMCSMCSLVKTSKMSNLHPFTGKDIQGVEGKLQGENPHDMQDQAN